MVQIKGKVLTHNIKELLSDINDDTVTLLVKADEGKSLEKLTNGERERIWTALNKVLNDKPESGNTECVKLVNGILELLNFILMNSSYPVEDDVSFINILTHINRDPFFVQNTTVRNNVSLINEYWLTKKMHLPRIDGMEYFTLKYLLENCTSGKPLTSDVQRLNAIRKVMTAAPFEIAVPSLRPLLIKLVQNQIVLNLETGQRFLAYSLILSEKLMIDIHRTILLDLSSCIRKKGELYAKIYLIAWQNADNKMRTHIEKSCFQHMMEAFLKEQRTSLELTKVGQNLLSILNVWHYERAKKNSDFITMITDCYQPIIWKYFESGFNVHRCNAVDLLFKAFPLQRPGDNVMDGERLFNQQFSAMMTALRDDCHIVRIISVREVCNILSHYWNSFTPIQIQRLLTVISKEDAYDASSAEVRRMVYVGFQSFLNNPLASEYLKQILPGMADNIHDINQKVRTAFIQLLLAIKEKGDPNFKYSEVVPTFSLYYRLAEENIKVGELIVKLLLSSYYQEEMPVIEWTRRFISLIKNYPKSYRNFFLYSQKTLSFENSLKIIYEILVQIGSYVLLKLSSEKGDNENENDDIYETKNKKTKRSKNKKPLRTINTTKESTDKSKIEKTKTRECAFDDPNVVGGLFDIVTILWVLHDSKLNKPENEEERIKLYDTYIKYAQPFINYYKDTTLFISILSMSGNIPASLLRSNSITLPGYCIKMLKSKQDFSCLNSNEGTLSMIIALIKWGKGGDVLEQVALWLEAAFETQNINDSILPRRRVKISETIQPNSVVAINILDTLLKLEFVKSSILKKNYEQLFDLWKFMSRVKGLIETRLEQGEPFEDELVSDDFLMACFKRYVKLIPLLKDNKIVENEKQGESLNSDTGSELLTVNYQQEIENLMQWAQDNLLPFLEGGIEMTEVILIANVYKDIMYVADNMIILNVINRQFYSKIIQLVLVILQTDYSLFFVKSATRIATAINYSGKLLFNVNDELNIFSKIVPTLVAHILNVLTCKKLNDDGIAIINEDMADVKNNLSKILETYQDNFKLKTNSRTSVKQLQMLIGIFVDAVVYLLSEELSPDALNLPTYSSVTQLPLIVSALISLFHNKKFWGSMFVHVLHATLTTKIYDVKCLLTSAILFNIFAAHDKKINRAELRKALCVACNLLTKAQSQASKKKDNICDSGSPSSAADQFTSSHNTTEIQTSRYSNADDNDSPSWPERLISQGLELISQSQVLLIANEQ